VERWKSAPRERSPISPLLDELTGDCMKMIRRSRPNSRELQKDAWRPIRDGALATLLVWSTGAVIAGIFGTPQGIGTVVYALIVVTLLFTLPALLISAVSAYVIVAVSYGRFPNVATQVIASAAAAAVLTVMGGERRPALLLWTVELACVVAAITLRRLRIRRATG
jgi:hypothetical protein